MKKKHSFWKRNIHFPFLLSLHFISIHFFFFCFSPSPSFSYPFSLSLFLFFSSLSLLSFFTARKKENYWKKKREKLKIKHFENLIFFFCSSWFSSLSLKSKKQKVRFHFFPHNHYFKEWKKLKQKNEKKKNQTFNWMISSTILSSFATSSTVSPF